MLRLFLLGLYYFYLADAQAISPIVNWGLLSVVSMAVDRSATIDKNMAT